MNYLPREILVSGRQLFSGENFVHVVGFYGEVDCTGLQIGTLSLHSVAFARQQVKVLHLSFQHFLWFPFDCMSMLRSNNGNYAFLLFR